MCSILASLIFVRFGHILYTICSELIGLALSQSLASPLLLYMYYCAVFPLFGNCCPFFMRLSICFKGSAIHFIPLYASAGIPSVPCALLV